MDVFSCLMGHPIGWNMDSCLVITIWTRGKKWCI